MTATKVKYELDIFWFDQQTHWKGEVGRRMQVHPNTVTNIIREGEHHPRYGELVENVKNTYGKIIKKETV